ERFERGRLEGGPLDGIQAWVALPVEDEETDPHFSHHGSDALPTFNDRDVRGRLVAGEALGLKAEVKTHSPLFYLHIELEPGARFVVPNGYEERAIYVASGSIMIGSTRLTVGEMAVLESGVDANLVAETSSVV